MKYFIINYGPPASGKGSIKNNISNKLGIEDYIDIDVDKIVIDICKKEKNENCDNMNQEQYMYYRKRKDAINADEISDNQLHESLQDGKNIIWETTGNNIEWIINTYIPLIRKYDYKIILSLPIVQLETIIKRCNLRKQAANCSKDYLEKVRNNSYKNFEYLAFYCDVVLIYNNNNSDPYIIYDSNNMTECKIDNDIINDKTKAGETILQYLKINCNPKNLQYGKSKKRKKYKKRRSR